jgi:GMP synthase-like glutamine amidotransferase
MNVYEVDKYPFLIKEERLLKEALLKEVPFLGICLGAQLLAKVAGARVYKAEQSEIGWYTIELTDGAKEDALFKNLPAHFQTFQWHEDTFAIPPIGTLLATSQTCKNQALGVGKCAWGLQFHPEMTGEMIKEWACASSPSLDVDRLLLEYSKKRHIYSRVAHQLYLNFANVINHYSAIKT